MHWQVFDSRRQTDRAIGAIPTTNLAGFIQLVRKLLLQVQLAEISSSLVDFGNSGAYARVTNVPDLDLALEALSRKKLAFEIQHLPDRNLPAAQNQEAVPAHVLNEAREPVYVRLQGPSLPDRNTRLRSQFSSSHGDLFCGNGGA